MEEATLTSKGQITIPKKIRKALGLTRGGKVIFVNDDGKTLMMPKGDPLNLLKRLRKDISFSQKDIERMIIESKRGWSKFR